MILKSSFPQGHSKLLDSSFQDDSASADIKVSFQVHTPFDQVQMIGSCRGFILSWDQSSAFYLWNPSTGVHKQIHFPPKLYSIDCCALIGFGYDPSADDYLVILVSCCRKHCNTKFEYFSLRDNSWVRVYVVFPCMNYYVQPRFGSLVNGSIHWIIPEMSRKDMPKIKDISSWIRDAIFAFDLVERSFSYINLPVDIYPRFNNLDVWAHKGMLSIWYWKEDSTETWVMKEYRVQSSWTKLIDVPVEEDGTPFIPIGSTKSGDIVGKYGLVVADWMESLVKLNARGEVLELWSVSDEYSNQAAIYEESLLSLPGVNGVEYVAASESEGTEFNVSMSIRQYNDKYEALNLEDGEILEDELVSLAGRIRRKESFSRKLVFYDLQCVAGNMIQILADASHSELRNDEFTRFHSTLKLGDIVGITGFPGKSKRGELSIFPKTFVVLPYDALAKVCLC